MKRMWRLALFLAGLCLWAGGCGSKDSSKPNASKGREGQREPRRIGEPFVVLPDEPDRLKPPAVVTTAPATPTPQPEPPNPNEVSMRPIPYIPPEPDIITGYFGGAYAAVLGARAIKELTPINQWLQTYEIEHGAYPKDIRELMRAYKQETRVDFGPAPSAYKYFYWPKQGVVKWVEKKDKRFADPTGVYATE